MMVRLAVRSIKLHIRFCCLLAHYFYLRVVYIYLLIKLYLLKAVGAALIEAAKIESCLRCLSKEDRLTFAISIAVSIYMLALIMFIRL